MRRNRPGTKTRWTKYYSSSGQQFDQLGRQMILSDLDGSLGSTKRAAVSAVLDNPFDGPQVSVRTEPIGQSSNRILAHHANSLGTPIGVLLDPLDSNDRNAIAQRVSDVIANVNLLS
jgi:hypothetical protein